MNSQSCSYYPYYKRSKKTFSFRFSHLAFAFSFCCLLLMKIYTFPCQKGFALFQASHCSLNGNCSSDLKRVSSALLMSRASAHCLFPFLPRFLCVTSASKLYYGSTSFTRDPLRCCLRHSEWHEREDSSMRYVNDCGREAKLLYFCDSPGESWDTLDTTDH